MMMSRFALSIAIALGLTMFAGGVEAKSIDERLEELISEGANHHHGSHTKSHYSILTGSKEADLNRLHKELGESQTYLEKVFARNIESFAFPRGEVDTGGADLALTFYTNLFSVEYGYFLPAFPKKIHGRFLVLKEGDMAELENYLDEASPLNSTGFPLISLLLVAANLFFWGRKKFNTSQ